MRPRNQSGFLQDWSRKGEGQGGERRSQRSQGTAQEKSSLHHFKSFQLYSEGTEELWEDFKLETTTIRLAFIKILTWAAE